MPIKRLLLSFSFFLVSSSLFAQSFSVDALFGSPRRGKVRLTVYDGGRQVLNAPVSGDRVHIEGSVSAPVLAELWHKSMSEPLLFYLENSDIRIEVDDRDPARSRVLGSRSNTDYRLLRESWDVSPRWNSPYAPMVLLDRGSEEEMLASFDRLEKVARQGEAYDRLRAKVERLKALRVGSKFPAFKFYGSDKKQVLSDSLLRDGKYNLVLIGAGFCDECSRVLRVADSLSHRGAEVNIVSCRIDDDPRQWDAPYLDMLAIDHIPYIILLDGKGVILERDVRVWELEGLLRKKLR